LKIIFIVHHIVLMLQNNIHYLKLNHTGSKIRKEQLNRDYPHDLVVLTKHWRELCWLLEKIYNNEHIIWQIDAANKYHLLSEKGEAAIDYMVKSSDETSPVGICLYLLHAGYRVVTGDFYKEY
jgi:hypothetical protein